MSNQSCLIQLNSNGSKEDDLMSAAKAWPRHFKAYKIMSGSCKKTETILLLHAVSAARLDSYGCVQEKHRGEATCEEQARPNNDDEPSNHVGLCYDTVMVCGKTLLVISPHHAGLCCHSIYISVYIYIYTHVFILYAYV